MPVLNPLDKTFGLGLEWGWGWVLYVNILQLCDHMKCDAIYDLIQNSPAWLNIYIHGIILDDGSTICSNLI